MPRTWILLCASLALPVATLPFLGAAESKTPQYTKSGDLILPPDYRQWVFLSSGIGMTYGDGKANPNPPFENVFVNAAAHSGYLKTGVWPDKTVMLLEIRASESRVSINKDGRVQTRVVAMEAHVKDKAKGGWQFYGFANGSTEGKILPKTADCFTCHEQNGSSDTTFVQFYPTLIDAAKKTNSYKETGH
jgi:hypothetical protein